MTCLNPVVADPPVVLLVQAVLVQAVLAQAVLAQAVLAQEAPVLVVPVPVALAQRGHAQVRLASPVKAPPRMPRWLDRTLA